MNNRKEHWEKVYTDKSPLEVSWYQTTPALSLRLIHAANVDRDSSIIDVGGGASRLVDHLCNEGYRSIAVLDISGKALAIAKERLGEQADRVQWIESDATEFEATQQFDIWHDRAVFHFLQKKLTARTMLHP